ncbi:MAG: hypothetical protein FJ098_08955 [Deltaproteobacteria bacterium]|nr:hypothetical protein [Deltaproteobacteria bacterium]
MKTWTTTKTVLMAALTLSGVLVVMGNTAPTCVPLEAEMQVVCLSDAECAGLEADADCPGAFACEDGECVFHCADEPPEPPEHDCTWDGDCGPGERCDLVDCWAPPCEEGEACPLGCMPIGFCVADLPDGCLDDTDCPEGFYCEPLAWATDALPGSEEAGAKEEFFAPEILGQCMPLPDPGCFSDADCAPGEICEFPYGGVPLPCIPEDEDCGVSDQAIYGICVPGPLPGCFSDADCAPGEICEFVEDCVPLPCLPEDEACFGTDCAGFGVCVPVAQPECWSDADCPEGFFCEPLYDGPYPGQGEKGGDAGMRAPMGICVPLPTECLSDADCKPGQICELVDCFWDCDGAGEYCGGDCAPYGTCVDVPVPPPSECFVDEDCPEGFECELLEGDTYPCDCDPQDEYCLMMYCMPVGICVEDPDPNPCKPTGCSGQLCAAEDIATTCEWMDHYACFQEANCGPFGPGGACAWEHTPELSACLAALL